MSFLEQLVALSKKKSREESGKAMRGVIDWWRGGGGDGGGSPSRKLRAFADQPGLATAIRWKEVTDGKSKAKKDDGEVRKEDLERCLVVWAFEDWLKKWFFEVLKSLEVS